MVHPESVLILGGGGREHALALGMLASPSPPVIHALPGNAGTAEVGTNHEGRAADAEHVLNLANELDIDLVVVGPEAPLAAGIADVLRDSGHHVFGPEAEMARLEADKSFANEVMESLAIPTARSLMLTSKDELSALAGFGPPWVIKRCGLAAGKGVTVTSEAEEAETAVLEALELDGHVLLESFLKGREASIFCLMDENAYRLLPASQDHKRAHDGDKGPNTGGMGAYAPAPLVTTEVLERVEEMVVKPMHAWTVAKGGYRGCLYIGLMIDDDGLPSVVEFNARFGDPETQVVVPLLGGHLLELLAATACGTLDQIEIPQISKAAVTVVLASEGYPGPSSVGHEFLVDHAEMSDDVIVHLAGVRSGSSGMLTSGGRVCGVTAVADGLPLARSLAYANISRVNYKGAWSRTDIGWQIVV